MYKEDIQRIADKHGVTLEELKNGLITIAVKNALAEIAESFLLKTFSGIRSGRFTRAAAKAPKV